MREIYRPRCPYDLEKQRFLLDLIRVLHAGFCNQIFWREIELFRHTLHFYLM